ncbi:MAG: T9SS type A sorting domain-containing protein [Bacteroidota bacterium]|jgi:hypothetical protein
MTVRFLGKVGPKAHSTQTVWRPEAVYLRRMFLSPLTILPAARGLLLAIVLMAVCFPSVAAEFALPDTISIAPGERREVALTGVIEVGGATTIRIRYTPGVVRIVSARGGDLTSQYCEQITVRDSIISGTEAIAVLTCPFSRPAIGDTVCFLTLEGIGGPDRIGQITIVSISASDIDFPVSRSAGGLVNRTGPIIGGQRGEVAITGNYPNPFAERTRIVFRVPIAEPVRMTLRTIQGRLIRAWSVDAVAGENSYELTILPAEAASGMYILELRSIAGTAYHSVRIQP